MPNWKKVVVSGSNAVLNHITASGNISASGDVEALTFTSPTLDVTAGSAQITANIPLTFGALISGNTGRLNIKHDDSDGTITNNTGLLTIGNTGAGGIKLGQSATQHVTASGNISSSGYIYGDQYYSNGGGIAYDNGTTTFYGNTKLTEIDGTNITLDAPVTASGNISASGTITTSGVTVKGHLTGKNSGLNDSHLTAFTNIQGYGNFQMGNSTTDTHTITGKTTFDGNITASGNISSSGTIIANQINLDNAGRIYFNEASATDQYISGEDSNILIESDNYLNVNADLAVNLNTPLTLADGIVSGSSFETTGHITSSGDISSSGNLYANRIYSDTAFYSKGYGVLTTDGVTTTVAKTGLKTHIDGTNIYLDGPVTASGNISASGTVQGLTGSFSALVGDTSQATSLEVDGPVTASAFVGERIFIGGASANISTTTQNKYFYGGSNGLSSNTWNVQVTDPTSIPQHYVNNLHMIPCGVTNITVRSHNRIALNSQPSIWIYTGSFGNDTNSTITMGFAVSQSLHSPADNTSNSGTHRYVINITGSKAFELTGDNDVIAVMMKNEGTAGAWRFNYRIDGITTE